AAVERAAEVYCVPVSGRVEVVITVAVPPLDVDLYQAHKAIEHGKLALAEGGSLILVARCAEGVGERGFVDLLSSFGSPREVSEGLRELDYRLGMHKAARIAETAGRSTILACTDLEDAVLESCFIEPCHDLQKTLDEEILRAGANAGVVVLMNGSMTVPEIRGHNTYLLRHGER
ncbi:hypothetical protein JW921_07375, partial [Candidatus Fermentibacterales bacterium]|nr:hypothetical protein [Candidatus Fermentibacterales bacterium]